jgi:hypothetical protein
MLAQLGGYRVGHDLVAMDLSRLAPVNRGVPTRFRVAVNGHPEIAGADSLLHDLFKLSDCLLLIHATRSLDDNGVSAVSSLLLHLQPFKTYSSRSCVWIVSTRFAQTGYAVRCFGLIKADHPTSGIGTTAIDNPRAGQSSNSLIFS